MTVLVRGDDHWVLPVAGQSVAQLCVNYAVTLQLANMVIVRMEQPFVITSGGEERSVIPEGDVDRLAPVLTLARTTVTDGAAFDDGHLELTFANGARVSVPATADFEPWEVVGPEGLRIVSVPDGELSVWHPRA